VVPTRAIWRTVEVLCALQNTETLAIVYGPSGTSRAFVVTSRPAVVAATAYLGFWRYPDPDVTMAILNSDLIAIRRVNMSFTTGVLGLVLESTWGRMMRTDERSRRGRRTLPEILLPATFGFLIRWEERLNPQFLQRNVLRPA